MAVACLRVWTHIGRATPARDAQANLTDALFNKNPHPQRKPHACRQLLHPLVSLVHAETGYDPRPVAMRLAADLQLPQAMVK